jgi:hypothetical protein
LTSDVEKLCGDGGTNIEPSALHSGNNVTSDLNVRAPHNSQASASPRSKFGPGAKTRGIVEAIGQLWPNEIPKGLSAKERNRAIIDRMKLNKSSIPKNPERAIQRVLKAPSK